MNRYSSRKANVVELTEERKEEQQRWKDMLHRTAAYQDRQAFSQLFDQFAPKIKAFAMANPYSNNPGQFADDLIQEVMIKIWNKASSYDPKVASPSTWIFTVARNCRIDMIRKQTRHDYPLDSDELLATDLEDEDGIMPFQAAQQQQYERELRQCFQQLPHEQAQIITKVYMEGKSHTEVSDELDLPLGTVKSRVRLALNKLKVMVAH